MRNLLSSETFTMACAALPLVSIDFVITRPGTNDLEVLLGLRKNRPAQGWWFTPGGRIRKNEPVTAAISRVASGEVGIRGSTLARATLIGVWDHLYSDSAFSEAVSTHYVNLAYLLNLQQEEADMLLLPAGEADQHEDWKWFSLESVPSEVAVHEYVKVVARHLLATEKGI